MKIVCAGIMPHATSMWPHMLGLHTGIRPWSPVSLLSGSACWDWAPHAGIRPWAPTPVHRTILSSLWDSVLVWTFGDATVPPLPNVWICGESHKPNHMTLGARSGAGAEDPQARGTSALQYLKMKVNNNLFLLCLLSSSVYIISLIFPRSHPTVTLDW